MITFFKNQNDTAEALKAVIDKYWAMQLDEVEFIKYVKLVIENNAEFLYKGNDYTTVVKQKLGAKRLRLLNKIQEKD